MCSVDFVIIYKDVPIIAVEYQGKGHYSKYDDEKRVLFLLAKIHSWYFYTLEGFCDDDFPFTLTDINKEPLGIVGFLSKTLGCGLNDEVVTYLKNDFHDQWKSSTEMFVQIKSLHEKQHTVEGIINYYNRHGWFEIVRLAKALSMEWR
jgi:hypothetical protein